MGTFALDFSGIIYAQGGTNSDDGMFMFSGFILSSVYMYDYQKFYTTQIS
jgi:hypothetical protein